MVESLGIAIAVVVALAATYYGASEVDPDVVDVVDVVVVDYNVLREEGDNVPEALMITCEATMGTDS